METLFESIILYMSSSPIGVFPPATALFQFFLRRIKYHEPEIGRAVVRHPMFAPASATESLGITSRGFLFVQHCIACPESR